MLNVVPEVGRAMGRMADEKDCKAFGAAMSACTREIVSTLSHLQESYGAGPVFAALIEIAGCSSCLGEGQPTMESLRALVARIEHHRQSMP